MSIDNFERNVFINCPFDEDFRPLFLAIIFTTRYFGYIPRYALERADSSENRIDKIISLIKESKFGIHDLSRAKCSCVGEIYRMNMPFELGIDYGYKNSSDSKMNRKKIIILEKEKYRFQQALSDLSGCDIHNHDDDSEKIINVVRTWFINEELGRGHSGNIVWDKYNDFNAYLYDAVVEENGHNSIDDVSIPEIDHYMCSWISENIFKTKTKS